MSALDTRLLDAHARDDRQALIALYEEAAEVANREEARGFYLTHAYVYALEAGAPQARGLRPSSFRRAEAVSRGG